MPAPRSSRQARSHLRRQQILAAALACFTETGTEQATVPEIGRRAGASIGSIYHQFSSKEGVAAALYLEGLRRYQQGLLAVLVEAPAARPGVFAVVAYHLSWAEREEPWARFLLEARRADFMAGHEEDIRNLNREFAQALAEWFRPHVTSGAIRRLPIDLYPAILLGPSHEWVRGRLGGRTVTPRLKAANALGEAAWQALAAQPRPHSS